MQDDSKNIQRMFDSIAHRYDMLNRVLSFRRDVAWRKKAIRLADIKPAHAVLDLACGTADMMLTVEKMRPEAEIFGGDFSLGMLELGKKKMPHGRFSAADAHNLPFQDESFDRMLIAFGFRNVVDKPVGLAEMHRVLKPGGRLVILEFSHPEGVLFSRLYRLYFTKILPKIGGILSGNRGAYDYLPDSVYRFPKKDAYRRMVLDAGFSNVSFNPMNFGIVDATVCDK